jgi:hypothetical protein
MYNFYFVSAPLKILKSGLNIRITQQLTNKN